MNSERRRLTQRIIPEQCDESHYEKVILCDVRELETPAWHVEEGDNQTSGAWGHQVIRFRNVLSLYSRLSSTISNFCIRLGVAETRPTCRSREALPEQTFRFAPHFKIFIQLFYILATVPSLSSPPSPLSNSSLAPPNPLPFLFRKWQT